MLNCKKHELAKTFLSALTWVILLWEFDAFFVLDMLQRFFVFIFLIYCVSLGHEIHWVCQQLRCSLMNFTTLGCVLSEQILCHIRL